MDRRARWPTVAFGAIPATLLAFPAGLAVLGGAFFSLSLKPLAFVMLATGVFGWVGMLSLWVAAFGPTPVNPRTATGLILGTASAALFVLLLLLDVDPYNRFGWWPALLTIGPVIAAISLVRRARRARLESGPSRSAEVPSPPRASAPPRQQDTATDRLERLLEAMLFLEVGGALLITPSTFDPHWGRLYGVLLTFPFVLGVLVTASWSALRHPRLRALAATLVVMLVVTPAAVYAMKWLFGPEDAARFASLGAMVWPLLALFVFPRRVARFLPRFALQRRWFSVALSVLFAALILAWLMITDLSEPWTLDRILEERHLALFALLSFLAGAFGLLFSYLAITQVREHRHTAHRIALAFLSTMLIIVSLPALTLLAIALARASIG